MLASGSSTTMIAAELLRASIPGRKQLTGPHTPPEFTLLWSNATESAGLHLHGACKQKLAVLEISGSSRKDGSQR